MQKRLPQRQFGKWLACSRHCSIWQTPLIKRQPPKSDTILTRKRINSIMLFANMDYKGVLLRLIDITGRNDWSSAMIYENRWDTHAPISTVGRCLLAIRRRFTQSQYPVHLFRWSWASYAIVGNDFQLLLIDYRYRLLFIRQHIRQPAQRRNLSAYNSVRTDYRTNLKPEKQHPSEIGFGYAFPEKPSRLFCLVTDQYKNQILALRISI